MTTVAQRLPTQSSRPAIHRTNLAQQSWIMVKRNMIHTKRMPEMLSDVTAQPIMFVLLFAYVFGASITNLGGPSYREFLLPGIQAQTIVFSAFIVAAVNGVMFTVLFPITFLANTFAPTEPMPHWLRVIAEWNPVSSLAQAMRELWGNGPPAPASAQLPLHHPVLATVLWSLALTAIFAPVALRAYARRTAD